MNNIIKEVLRLLPVTIIGLLFNKAIIGRSNGGIEVFDNLILGFLVLCFIVSFLVTLLNDRKIYKQTQLKWSFVPTMVGIVFIVSFLATNAIVAARDKSPVLISAGHEDDFNGAWFEFREDGTYKYANIRGLIGVTYTRGKYTFKDSLITLDTNKIDDYIESNLLVIRKEVYDTTEQVMYQLNHGLNVIEKSNKFVVGIDKRE